MKNLLKQNERIDVDIIDETEQVVEEHSNGTKLDLEKEL